MDVHKPLKSPTAQNSSRSQLSCYATPVILTEIIGISNRSEGEAQ